MNGRIGNHSVHCPNLKGCGIMKAQSSLFKVYKRKALSKREIKTINKIVKNKTILNYNIVELYNWFSKK